MALVLPCTLHRIGTLIIHWDQLLLEQADGTRVKLTPKAAQVLWLLASSAGATVKREQFFEQVWPQTFPNDEVLNTVVNELRRALGDNPRAARYIATVPKLGYRWIGPAPEAASATREREAQSVATTVEPRTVSNRRTTAIALGLGAVLVASLALWRWYAGDTGVASNETAQRAPVPQPVVEVNDVGVDRDPRLSLDGRRFVFVHDDADSTALRLREFGHDESQTLLAERRVRFSSPALSPDGTQVAYLAASAEIGCELRLLSLVESAQRVLSRECPDAVASSLAWRADGASILFTRFDAQALTVGERQFAIHEIAVANGAVRRITRSPAWPSVDIHPRISPDGARIAFVRDADGRHELRLAAADGTQERALPLAGWPYRAEWIDANTLLVAGHGRSARELWRVTLDTGQSMSLNWPNLGPGMTYAAATGILLVEQHLVDDNIWRVNWRVLDAAPAKFGDFTGSELMPRVSPDGSQLAYISDRSGNLELEVRVIETGKRISASRVAPFSVLDARWSPDARVLAVLLGTDAGKRLALLDPATGARHDTKTLIADLNVETFEWMIDGDALAVIVAEAGQRTLRRVPYPSLDAATLLIDGAVASIGAGIGDAALTFKRMSDSTLYRITRAGSVEAMQHDAPVAVPANYWAAQADMLIHVRSARDAETAWLYIVPRAQAGVDEYTFNVRLPEPPLGRPFDLAGDTLWYAQRDRHEVDLVALSMTASAHSQDK
jgi:DNA-binding winged helix-turn-helix (wHTH) protein/Tol biopolymer transport system component